jgi:hypothetical protein
LNAAAPAEMAPDAQQQAAGRALVAGHSELQRQVHRAAIPR